MVTQKISWLHLSDFHIGQGKDTYGQGMVFEYIINHVAEKKKSLDMILITGDIAFSGQAEEYKLFQQKFVKPMKKLVGSSTVWLMVPGNHDVDRSNAYVQNMDRDEVLTRTQKIFEPTESGRVERQGFLPGLQGYTASIKSPQKNWLASGPGFFQWSGEFHGVKLGVVGINTAWLSKDNRDKGQLTPGKWLVEEGLKQIQSCPIKIVMGHHPVDWWVDSDQQSIKALFRKYQVLYLHGHLHQNSVEIEPDWLALQAGSAFQGREHDQWKNRVLWGEIDLNQSNVGLEPYTWSSVHQTWVLDSEAYHPRYREAGTDCWVFELPGHLANNTSKVPKPVVVPSTTPGGIPDSTDESYAVPAESTAEPALDDTVTYTQIQTTWLPKLADLYHEEQNARSILQRIDYPKANIPPFTSSQAFWQKIAEEINNGRMENFDGLFAEVAKEYPFGAFKQWAQTKKKP